MSNKEINKPIQFSAIPSKVGSVTIIHISKSASKNLPSRGLVIIEGTINGYHFQAPCEPDGMGSHWFKIDTKIKSGAKIIEGKSASVTMSPLTDIPEPQVPKDLKDALKLNPQIEEVWKDITPLSRWDWIRWIGATKNPQTRKIRIEKTLSKLNSGKRSACCFNRSECTDPQVSHNGKLIDQIQYFDKSIQKKK